MNDDVIAVLIFLRNWGPPLLLVSWVIHYGYLKGLLAQKDERLAQKDEQIERLKILSTPALFQQIIVLKQINKASESIAQDLTRELRDKELRALKAEQAVASTVAETKPIWPPDSKAADRLSWKKAVDSYKSPLQKLLDEGVDLDAMVEFFAEVTYNPEPHKWTSKPEDPPEDTQ